MPEAVRLTLEFALWAVVAMSVCGATVVPLYLWGSLQYRRLIARRRAARKAL